MENFENICRTCSLQGELHPIFCADTADMLSDIIDIKVIKGDNFPQNICTFCLEKLNSAFNFKKQCKDIYKKFEEYIKVNLENSNKIKEEVVIKSEEGVYVLVDDEWNEDWKDDVQNSPKEENTIENVQNTKDNNDKDTEYRECKICLKVLKRGSFLRHYKLHIDDRRFICDICGKSFLTGYKLKIHKRLHSDETPYKCKYCENSYKGDENLLHHMKIKHPEELLSSDTKRGKRNLTIYKCEVCHEEYLVKAYYERHLRTHAIEPPYPCPHPLCDRGYFSRYELKVHSSIHSEESPYKCLYCTKTFKLKRNQYFHMRLKHLDLLRLRYKSTDLKNYECKICNRNFKSQLNYNQHKVVHAEISNKDRPFLCWTCGRSFTKQSSLYNHQEKCLNQPQIKKSEPKVTEDGKFECEDCGRVYQHKHTLVQHQKVHSKNYKPKSFLCNYCAKSFCSKASLETHINTHTGAKPYKCTICGRAFAQHAALSTHQRVHTGEKPYKCEICGREFAFKVPFKYHALVHTGEKPHECSVCGRRFALNGNLTVHMRTHTGETPYVCTICNKGFYNSNNLKKHKKKHVKENGQ